MRVRTAPVAAAIVAMALQALPMAAGSGFAAALPAVAGSEANTDAVIGTNTDTIIGKVSAAWFRLEWNIYAARFIAPEGRVVDNANKGISHSEGQGYGLLLAALAGDAGRFDALWRWTAQNLMVRKDGLAAWKWDPRMGAVADMNNATDGDILIAWALSEGARRFGRADYRLAAEGIARSVGTLAVRAGKQGPLLMPGTKGFDENEQPDGPVVNLSYWVFPALPALKALAPDTDWDSLGRNGMTLLEASRFGPYGLPTEWESVVGQAPQPARNFRAEFGYNAIRIPLYLALEGGPASRRALQRFAGAWTQTTARPVDVKVAAVTPPLGAPGYDLVFALARCVVAGQVIPADVIKARSDLYYPETLRLLSIIAIQERAPQCL